jgi:predicted MPP superfamily phosphohydrolase
MNIFFIAAPAVFQILFVLSSFIIYKIFIAAFGAIGLALFLILVVLSFIFFFAPICAMRYQNRFVHWFDFFGTYWLGFIGLVFCGCLIFLLIENIAVAFGWQIVLAEVGWILFFGVILIYVYGAWNARTIKITRVNIRIPHRPEWWRGKKIVFISDTHFGNEYGVRFAAKLIRKISSLAPQAVFIGGDFFDGVKCDPDALIKPFRGLQTPHGVYFVSGNHEYINDSELFFAAVRRAGIVILNNEKITIEGIDFLGVDFEDTEKRNDFEKIVTAMSIDPVKTNVLVKHIPDNLDVAERAGVSLELCGHTHHGQIFPVSILSRIVFKGYDYGLKQFGKMAVYTSSGAGASPVPLRIGTRSEIVLVEFE